MNQWPTPQQEPQAQWPLQQDVLQPQWPPLPPVPQPQWSQGESVQDVQPQWSPPQAGQDPPWQQPSPSQGPVQQPEQQFSWHQPQQPRRQFQRPLQLLPPAEPSAWPQQPYPQQAEWSQQSQPQLQQFTLPTPLAEQPPLQQIQVPSPLPPLEQSQAPQNRRKSGGKKRRGRRLRWILVAALVIVVLAIGGFFRYQSPVSIALSYAKAGIHQDFTAQSKLICAQDKPVRLPNNVTAGNKIDDSGLTTSVTSETFTQATVRVSGSILYTLLPGSKTSVLYSLNVRLVASGLGWCVTTR